MAEYTVNNGNSKLTVMGINPLHAYTSTTYAISLHVLTPELYNQLITFPANASQIISQVSQNKFTLISGASRYHNSRNQYFTDDFYFQSLSMHSVIGMNDNSRGTNVIHLKFTIVEPHGMSFLDRLVLVAQSGLSVPNYMELPYLLEVNFFAYDDNGNPSELAEHTKYIPIKFIGCKISAGAQGASYDIEAIPFNHQAYLESAQATPAKFEITATTVGDMFQNIQLDGSSTASTISTATAQQLSQSTSSTTGNTASSSSTSASSKPITINTPSYVAAYNLWYANLAKNKNTLIQYPDVITVIWSPMANWTNPAVDFVNSKVLTPGYVPLSRAAQYDATILGKNTAAKANNRKIQAANPITIGQLNKQVQTIDAGTSVIDVLNNALINSTYVSLQLVDPATQTSTGSGGSTGNSATTGTTVSAKGVKNLTWFRITPVVYLTKNYDYNRNCYARDIIYCIQPYTYYNQKDNRAYMSQPTTVLRDYEYLYTGKNLDIIDWKIEYDYLYYTAQIALPNKTEAVTNSKNAKPNKQTQNPVPPQGINPTPGRMVPLSQTQQGSTSTSQENSVKTTAASVANNIYTKAVDMINLTMTVVGDPQFIKQDDFFYNPLGSSTEMINPYQNNSFNMDSGQVCVRLSFNTPVDFDDTTGLNRNDPKIPQRTVAGIYIVQEVYSEFNEGQFTQKLTMYRQYNQGDPSTSSTMNNTSQRLQDQLSSNNSAVTLAAAANQTALPGIPNITAGGVNTGISALTAPVTDVLGTGMNTAQQSAVTAATNALNPLTQIVQSGPTVSINSLGL